MFRAATLAALAGLLTLIASLPFGPHPAAVSSAVAQEAANGTRCEIRTYKRGGQTVVEGVVYATEANAGSFRLSVNGPTDNDQSGSFQASPTGATSLGLLAVGPGSYAAHMHVRWKGGSTECAQHAG